MKKRLFILSILIVNIVFIFIISTSSSSEKKIYILKNKDGVLVSENEGRSWSSFNEGLPDNIKPIRLYAGTDYMYLTTWDSGIYALNITSNSWKQINSEDFKRKSIYFDNSGYRKISAFAVDPLNSRNIITATKHTIYKSINAGKIWQEVSIKNLNKKNYITALAIKNEKIYIGTSFNGIYELEGSQFRHSGRNLPAEPYSRTLKFTEQVSNISTNSNYIYASFYFGGGIFYKKTPSNFFKPILNKKNIDETVYDLVWHKEKLYYSSNKKIYSLLPKTKPEELKTYNNIISKLNKNNIISMTIFDKTGKYPPIAVNMMETENSKPRNASKRNAIYVSIPALKKNLNKYITLTKKTPINAFVIDMKDDFGNIYFSSKNKIVKEIKSQRKSVNIKSTLKTLKKQGIYSIARIVVFKDKKMFSAYNGKYAIKNKTNGKPWRGTNLEFWVDPYSTFVHDYNIALAVELEELGFDEIQFDYIRFPSDGPINLCNFTYQKNSNTYKSEILIDFLKKGKKNINIPISVDVYGFNSWYHFGNWIGQDVEELSHVIDIICPMIYPSHFGNSFYKKGERSKRPYRIVFDSGKRAINLTNATVIIRPYLQAFNLLSPTWGTDYIKYQINAATDSKCSGYTLWNARGDYQVPQKALIVD